MARESHNRQASALLATALAHLFAAVVTGLVLIWVLHFREGLGFRSHVKAKIFNIHPLLMTVGFVLIGGEAIMAYQTVPAGRITQKRIHWMLHLVALLAGILGIFAVFKFHEEQGIPHLYTLHSWVGIVTIGLYGLQWLYSLFTFAFSRTKASIRAAVAPWHVFGGMLIFLLGVCTALMGLIEKFTYLKLQRGQEALLMNFTGLMILMFAATAGLGILLPRISFIL